MGEEEDEHAKLHLCFSVFGTTQLSTASCSSSSQICTLSSTRCIPLSTIQGISVDALRSASYYNHRAVML